MMRFLKILFISAFVCIQVNAQVVPPVNVSSMGMLRGIKITWDRSASQGVIKYVVYRSTQAFLPMYFKLVDIQANSNTQYQFTDATAQAGIRYFYYVTAKTILLESGPSETTSNKLTASANSIVIISDPVTQFRVGNTLGYRYRVQAISPDTGGVLNYTLLVSPTGMTINSDGEMIWMNPVVGNYLIGIKVTQNTGNRIRATQFFALRVVQRTGSITGLVQASNGISIPRARVILFNVGNPENIYETRAGTNGVYYLTDVTVGTYYIVAEAVKAGYGYRWYPNASKFVNATPVVIVDGQLTTADFINSVPVPGATKTISGTARNQNGSPLANVNVSAYLGDKYFPIGKDSLRTPNSIVTAREDIFLTEHSTTTNSNGGFTLTLPQGKTFYLVSRKNGYKSTFRGNVEGPFSAQPLLITNDPDTTLFLMKPQATGVKVSGTLADAFTQLPVVLTPVVLVQRGGGHVMFAAVPADSSGRYEFEGVTSGWYSLLAAPLGNYIPAYYKSSDATSIFWQQSDSFYVSNTNKTDLDINIPSTRKTGLASIAGQVTDSGSNDPIGALTVFAFATSDTINAVAYAITDSIGDYKVDGLLPGTYILKTDKGGYNTGQTSSITVNYTGNIAITNISIAVSLNSLAAVKPNQAIDFQLGQNYPNPFSAGSFGNPSTIIKFGIPKNTFVTLRIFNNLGQEVKTIFSEFKNAGNYSVEVDGFDLPSGVYYYQLQAPQKILTRHMVVIR